MKSNGEPDPASLLVLGQSVLETPGVNSPITSHPETHIISSFRGPTRRPSDFLILTHIEPCIVDSDIRHFFKHELSGLVQRCDVTDGWPAGELLYPLSTSFFVYVVVMPDTSSSVPRIGSRQL